MKESDLGLTILEAACSSEAKDVAIDLSEIGVDAIFDDGILKAIPVIGSIINLLKAGVAVRDRLFVLKVAKFLFSPTKLSQTERAAFANRIKADDRLRKRLGDTLVLILDRLDDLQKSEMLAKAFAACVKGTIEFETFQRLAAAIDIGFVEDLKALAAQPFDHIYALHPALLRTGLVEIHPSLDVVEGAFRQAASLTYSISELGKIFVRSMEEKGE